MLNFSSYDINQAIRLTASFFEESFKQLSQSLGELHHKKSSMYYHHLSETYGRWSQACHEPFFLSSASSKLNGILNDYSTLIDASKKYSLQLPLAPQNALTVLETAHQYFQEKLRQRQEIESPSLKRKQPITPRYSLKKSRDGHHSKAYSRGEIHAKTYLNALKACDKLEGLLNNPNGKNRFRKYLKKESTFAEFIAGGMEVYNRMHQHHASKLKPTPKA